MTHRHTMPSTLLAAVFFCPGALLAGAASAAPLTKVIYTFHGQADGSQPVGDLLPGANGSLIGLTAGGGPGRAGEAFMLTPPSGGGKTWTKTVLYGFTGKADGGTPTVGLTDDSSGNLYGSTIAGGKYGYGTVFALSPGKSGYSETVLYDLQAAQAGIGGKLTFDSAGNLYGVSTQGGGIGCGGVFQFSPPSGGGGSWTALELHDFSGPDGCTPMGSVAFDSAGNLYGTAAFLGGSDNGDIYMLSYANQKWTFTDIYDFTGDAVGAIPEAGVSIAHDGTIVGTTVGDFYMPTVFSGMQAGKGWKFKPVAALNPQVCGMPQATLLLGANNIAYGSGAAPSCAFQVQLGPKRGKSRVIGLPPAYAHGGLTSDSAGNLYGATQQGQYGIGYGTIYELKGKAD